MRRYVPEEDDWSDEESQDENFPADPWASDEEDDATVPCPYCRQEIYEDAERCPHCGRYISEEDAPSSPKPWWIIVGALLCLLVIWYWIASGPFN